MLAWPGPLHSMPASHCPVLFCTVECRHLLMHAKQCNVAVCSVGQVQLYTVMQYG